MAPTTKPTALKLVTGTARPGRMNPDELQPKTEIPPCPSALSAGAKTEWRRIAPLLEAQGGISHFDQMAVAMYCEIYARWKKALRELAKPTEQGGGEIVKTPNGSMQVSPWLSIARSAEKEGRMFASEYGFTWASRSKVDVKTPKEKIKPEGKDRFFK